MVLGIAVDVPLRRLFDYRAPPGTDPVRLQPGVRLWVPFGRRRVTGVLVELRPSSDLPESKLRAAIAVIDETPVLDAPLLELLRWAADYYRHPPGEVIAAALPVPLRMGAAALETEERWALSAAARTGELPPLSPRAHRLRELVAALEHREAADAATLAALSPRWREHVRELEQRGWVLRLREVTSPAVARPPSVGAGLEPTPEQQRAIEAIAAAAGRPAPFLLHGVTGSGKTEVYLRAIARARPPRAAGAGAGAGDRADAAAGGALRGALRCPLAVLHSGSRDQERLRAWRAARSGEAPVVIGTRSAIFVPLPAGLIVVDEEHDSSYKQQEGFRYSARDLALARAQRLSACRSCSARRRRRSRVSNARAGRTRGLGAAGAHRQAPATDDPPRRPAQACATQGIATPRVFAIKRHLDAGGRCCCT
jgi:primosomal protein N' (replication factor Y) (superfamily II helicase)